MFLLALLMVDEGDDNEGGFVSDLDDDENNDDNDNDLFSRVGSQKTRR